MGAKRMRTSRKQLIEEPATLADRTANGAGAQCERVPALEEAARNAAMYLATGFITCPRCGEDVETKNTDAEYTLRAALSSPDHADAGKVEGEGWLPIESAPKDGAAVLVHFVPNEIPSLNQLICAAYWQKSDGLMKPGFWRVFHSVGPSFKATHWRPLPSAPASEGAE